MTLRLSRRAVLAQGAACLAVPTIGRAQDARAFPSRPIRIVVAFAPGGALDLIARDVARSLTQTLGQSVFVENKAGASGAIGTKLVASSAPDGYTLLAVPTSFLLLPHMVQNATYDPLKDFAPVSNLAFVPQVLMVNAASGQKSLPDLLQALRSRPGEMTYGSGGVGTSSHMAAELLSRHANVKMVHVPYKGNAPALVDLLGGRLSLMFDNISSGMEHIKGGRLLPLGVTSPKRFMLLPDVPAIGEALPGYEASIFQGLLAPAKTPADIVEKLRVAIVRFTSDPANMERYRQAGTELSGSESPSQFAKQLAAETERLVQVIKSAGIKVE